MDIREHLQESLGATYALEDDLGDVGPWRAFLAIDADGRKVVVKVLAPERAAIVDAERFLKEVEYAGALQHPLVAPVLTVGLVDGLPFYVMEQVHGVSMRERLDRIGELVLPVDVVLRLLHDMAAALAFAHANGVVHGDIKPDNVFDVGGSVVITDFGIWQALIASRHHEPGANPEQHDASWLGTPAYMAPEQAAEDPATDQRADLYGFGCTAYELLTGKPPFTGKTATELIVAHATESPASLQVARIDAPSMLTRLVMRCLQKDPTQRPDSAADVLRYFEAGGAAPEQIAKRASGSRWGGRRIAIMAGVAVVLVLSILGVVRYNMSHQATGLGTEMPVVAVMPFRVSGGSGGVSFLREGMVELIGVELAPAASLRALNVRAVMAAWRKAGGSETADIPDEAAAASAQKAGADRVVTGDVTGDASNLTIAAKLIDAMSRRELGHASVHGTLDNVPTLIDELVTRLLGVKAGEGNQRIASLVSASPTALRAYLQGRSAFRLDHVAEAERLYNAALDADSTAPLIALRLLEANARLNGDVRDDRASRIALRNQARLAARNRLLLNVLVGHWYGRHYTGNEFIATAESLTVVQPDSPEAWTYLGDGYYRFGAMIGMLDADRQAERTTTRALMLDSAYAPALERKPAIYAAIQDTSGLRRAMSVLARDSASDLVDGVMLAAAYRLGDNARLQTYRERIPRMSWGSLVQVVLAALEGRASIDDAERAVAAMSARASTPSERDRADNAAYTLALDRGQPTRAEAINSRNPDPVRRLANTLSAYVFWDGNAQNAAAAATAVAELRAKPVSPDLKADERRNLLQAFFYEAEFRVSKEDIAGAQFALSAVRSVPFPEDSSGPSSLRARFAMLIETQLALLRQSEDTRDRLVRLDSILQEGHLDAFSSAGALMAARSWMALGEPQRALDALSRPVRGWGPFELFGSTRIRENGGLSEILGQRNGAMRSYRHFLLLRTDPEPALRADAAHVRTRLDGIIKQGPAARSDATGDSTKADSARKARAQQ